MLLLSRVSMYLSEKLTPWKLLSYWDSGGHKSNVTIICHHCGYRCQLLTREVNSFSHHFSEHCKENMEEFSLSATEHRHGGGIRLSAKMSRLARIHVRMQSSVHTNGLVAPVRREWGWSCCRMAQCLLVSVKSDKRSKGELPSPETKRNESWDRWDALGKPALGVCSWWHLLFS